jgi:Bacteriophage T4-like portal protein (Gp20)
LGSSQNPLTGGPTDDITVFGKIVTRIKKLLAPETEQEPLELSYGTDAEARGYGSGAVWDPQVKNLGLWAQDKMRLEAGRFAAYRDYELMDSEMPEVSSALDVFGEFSTQSDDPKAETFKIDCDDEDFAGYLKDKADQLKLPERVTPTAREIAKYGTSFWECVSEDDAGDLTLVKPLGVSTMRRNEDRWGVLKPEAFTQMDPETNQPIAHFPAWQVVQGRYTKMHGRLYGNSLLEPARKVYKQIQLIEDGMVVGRLYRSHMRYIFQIPVDGMSADQAEAYLDKKKLQLRKKNRFNPANGKLEQFDSPIGADEDFFMGVRKEGVQGKVETIQGQGSLSDIGDVEYFHRKLFSALKVPAALLGFEKDINSISTVTEQTINFARTLRRLQQVVAGMVHETLTRAMILDGYDPEKVPDWSVVMPEVSTTDDLRKSQVDALQANIALIYGNKLPIVDAEFIYKNIMKLSTEEIERLQAVASLGIEAMPIPAPPLDPNVPAAAEAQIKVAKVTNPPAPGGQDVNNPGDVNQPPKQSKNEMHELSIVDENDRETVMRIRRELELPENDEISSGELLVARQLREFNSTFGQVVVTADSFRDALVRARNGNH